MKTDDLIDALAADADPGRRSVSAALLWAAGLGGGVTAALFFVVLGSRPDFASALQTWRFDLKLSLVALTIIAAMIDCARAAQPVATVHPLAMTRLLVIPLAAAVALELALVPRTEWAPRLVGTKAAFCLALVPTLATLPFLAILAALRTGAPSSPAMSGMAGGTLAGALGALLYATYCIDDSPLFVAVWYPLAVMIVAVLGALVGRAILRW